MSFEVVDLVAAGTPVAFSAVFGVFVTALVVLAVVTVRWAVRRDRAGRADWVRRRGASGHGGSLDGAATNGHAPSGAPGQAAGTNVRPPDRNPNRDRGRRRRARAPRSRP
ncbi:MAG: hypothetical protein ACP5PM_01330 [Acidimicrobiales bacterium]